MVLEKKRAALLRRRAKTRAQRNHVLLPAHLDDVKRLIQQGSLPQAYEQLKGTRQKTSTTPGYLAFTGYRLS